MVKSIELRQRAVEDVDTAIVHFQREGGASLAMRFIDALEHALRCLAERPSIGSLRLSYELGVPDLRVWSLGRFPYLVFYVEGTGSLDVWRVLHAHRDLPTSLVPPEPDADDRS